GKGGALNRIVYMLLFCGCAFAGSPEELARRQGAPVLNPAQEIKPVVELTSRSHISFDRSLHRTYLSGTLFAQVNSAELTSRTPVTNIVALIEGLQKLGFFELSESGIKQRIDEVRERTGKGVAVC